MKPSHETQTIALVGTTCTRKPVVLDPLRVLFILDASDGLALVDPQDEYLNKLQEIVEQLAEREGISFGFIRFGETIHYPFAETRAMSTGFTSELKLLQEVFALMKMPASQNPKKYLVGRDYGIAIKAAQEYIQNDIDTSLLATKENNLTYLIHFISAGQTQADELNAQTKYNTILAEQKTLLSIFPRIEFFTYSMVPTRSFYAVLQNTLLDMALLGKGVFSEVLTPTSFAESLKKTIHQRIILRTLDLARIKLGNDERRSIVVSNRNQRVDNINNVTDSYVDSDGDGLPDAYELSQGYNPYNADTDGDGLDDYFEDRFRRIFDPLVPKSPILTAAEAADSDQDGLNAFVELQLGTSDNMADTDGDGIGDFEEFRAGTNPLIADLEGDLDNDGRSNGLEILQHLNPLVAESSELAYRYGYDIQVDNSATSTPEGQTCYAVRVKNITLYKTLTSVDQYSYTRPQGYNHIEIQQLERPLPMNLDLVKMDYLPRIHKGTTGMIIRPDMGWRDPPAMQLFLYPGHFAQ